MPSPLGRDRLETPGPEDGAATVVLASRQEKDWEGRVEGARGPAQAGTAVRWEGEIWEVLRVSYAASGGVRYAMAPWDERNLIRRIVDYVPIETGSVSVPAPVAAPVASAPGSAQPSTGPRFLAAVPEPLRPLAVSLPVALVAPFLCPLRVFGEGMSFLSHELGHTFAAWLVGRFALPSPILTIWFEQSLVVAGLIWAGILFLTYRLRANGALFPPLAVAAGAYPLIAFTPLNVDFISAMGHGTEILAVCLLFRWALFGRGLRASAYESWERPIYAFFAWYVWFRNMKLFLGIATDRDVRTDYQTVAIAGHNDFVKIAMAHGLRLEALAAVTAVFAVLVPALFLAWAWKRRGTLAEV
ncbi:MAG: hypothetical protein JNK60_20120 [Acidobacteria bacterium]|nr:hypothetical protein [Acidobacteriota bacterium]